MKESELKELTTEELVKKEKGLKTFIGVFIGLIIALLFFNIKDYLENNEVENAMSIITICTIGGMVSLFPEYKAVKKELKSRN